MQFETMPREYPAPRTPGLRQAQRPSALGNARRALTLESAAMAGRRLCRARLRTIARYCVCGLLVLLPGSLILITLIWLWRRRMPLRMRPR
jgi:hypothetical protein